jgi:hypothetical protein
LISKNTENFTEELDLLPIKGKNIALSFSGDRKLTQPKKTIQIESIKTAAWVKELKTRIKIELPQFCADKYV